MDSLSGQDPHVFRHVAQVLTTIAARLMTTVKYGSATYIFFMGALLDASNEVTCCQTAQRKTGKAILLLCLKMLHFGRVVIFERVRPLCVVVGVPSSSSPIPPHRAMIDRGSFLLEVALGPEHMTSQGCSHPPWGLQKEKASRPFSSTCVGALTKSEWMEGNVLWMSSLVGHFKSLQRPTCQ